MSGMRKKDASVQPFVRISLAQPHLITLDVSEDGSSQQGLRGATRLCPGDGGLQGAGGKCRDLITIPFSFFNQLLRPGLRLEAGYKDEHSGS